jgi:hypothetical protein
MVRKGLGTSDTIIVGKCEDARFYYVQTQTFTTGNRDSKIGSWVLHRAYLQISLVVPEAVLRCTAPSKKWDG